MRRRLIALIAAASLVLANGCGDEGEEGSEDDAVDVTATSPRQTAISIGHCLEGAGYRVQLLPPQEGDHDAPDYAVGYQKGTTPNGGGEIAVYETEAEASERLPDIQAHAEPADGVAEQHGSLVVVYFADPSREVKNDVAGCLI